MLTFGEKATARVPEVAPGVVQVTLSSDLQFGLGSGRGGGDGRDRMSNALNQLLPPAPLSATGAAVPEPVGESGAPAAAGGAPVRSSATTVAAPSSRPSTDHTVAERCTAQANLG